MSFFAGFVNGVMRGADWREGSDDRATERERNETRWDWTQEDREFELSERERVARERQEGRARAASARSEAATRRQQEQDAWSATIDQMNGGASGGSTGGAAPQEPISIWYDEPVTNQAAPQAGNAPTRQPAISAPVPETDAEPVTATRPPRPEVSRQRANRDNKVLPLTDGPASLMAPETAPQRRPAIEDNAPIPTADSLRRDASRRGATAQEYWQSLSPEQRGSYSSVQMPGRVPVTPEGGAEYMAPHAVNPSYAEPGTTTLRTPPIPQVERYGPNAAREPISIAPDAPQAPVTPPAEPANPEIARIEAALAQAPQPAAPDRAATMAAQAGQAMPAARAAVTPRMAAPISLPESISRPHQRTQEQIDADLARMPAAFRGEPIAPPRADAPPAPRTGVAAEMAGQSQADRGAISAVGRALTPEAMTAPDASMTAEERQARAQLVARGQTTGRPLSGVEMPPAPAGAAPAAPAARGPVSVRPEIRQQAAAAPAQAPRTASGTPAISVQTQAQETVAAAQQQGNRGQANTPQARQEVAERFVQRYRRDAIPPIVELYMRRGQVDQAREVMEFFNDMEVQQGMQAWSRAIHAYSMNDTEGMVEGLLEAYNNESYYPDGLSAVRRGTRFVENEAGEIIGADIQFRDNATGRTFTQQIRGIDDLIAVGVGTLSPEAALEQFLSRSSERRENRPEGPSVSDLRQIREQAYDEISQGGMTQPSAEAVQERMQQILQSMGVAASGMGARSIPVMH